MSTVAIDTICPIGQYMADNMEMHNFSGNMVVVHKIKIGKGDVRYSVDLTTVSVWRLTRALRVQRKNENIRALAIINCGNNKLGFAARKIFIEQKPRSARLFDGRMCRNIFSSDDIEEDISKICALIKRLNKARPE